MKLPFILRFSVGHLSQLKGYRFNIRIETQGIHGGLLERPAQTPPTHCGTNAFTCSFEVEDFDHIAEKILAQGGQIAMEKFAIPGQCWQGYFLDPDHNTFGLVQVDSNAQ